LVPNWNSSVMPVTTPTAKLMRKSFPKNLVAFFQSSSPVRTQAVSRMATRSDNPRVRGTNRKWK